MRVATIFTKARSLEDEQKRVGSVNVRARVHNDESRLEKSKDHSPLKSPYTLPAPPDPSPAGWASPPRAGARASSPQTSLPSLPHLSAFEITSALARAGESSKKRSFAPVARDSPALFPRARCDAVSSSPRPSPAGSVELSRGKTFVDILSSRPRPVRLRKAVARLALTPGSPRAGPPFPEMSRFFFVFPRER